MDRIYYDRNERLAVGVYMLILLSMIGVAVHRLTNVENRSGPWDKNGNIDIDRYHHSGFTLPSFTSQKNVIRNVIPDDGNIGFYGYYNSGNFMDQASQHYKNIIGLHLEINGHHKNDTPFWITSFHDVIASTTRVNTLVLSWSMRNNIIIPM